MSAIPLRHPLRNRAVEYPSSDGKPMAESDLHRDEMIYVIEALKAHFLDAPDVYVSGNLLLYYVEGDPRYSISPDALVATGLADAKSRRDIYKVWEEGRVPCWVMEVTSKSTRSEDLRKKKDLYRHLGVEEYLLFDPREEYLHPPLQGFRLTSGMDGEYRPISLEGDGSLVSPLLGIRFRQAGEGLLRLINLHTGRDYLRAEEKDAANQKSEERATRAEELAAREAQARQALESEIAELRRQMKREVGS